MVKTFLTLILAGLMSFGVFSQKVYVVNYPSQADLKVKVVDYASQADLLVFKEEIVSQVKGNKGIWYFTDVPSEADKKVIFVKYASQADLKVYFVDYRSQACWADKNKTHLLSSIDK